MISNTCKNCYFFRRFADTSAGYCTHSSFVTDVFPPITKGISISPQLEYNLKFAVDQDFGCVNFLVVEDEDES